MTNKKTKTLVELSILSALVIVLQLIANNIKFGPVCITLSLIPVLIGALCHGVKGGAILGFVNGIIVLLASDTQVFLNWNFIGTIIVCLSKTTIAGIIAALIFKLFKEHKFVGSIISAIIVPIINTGLFVIACLTIFKGDLIPENTASPFLYIILTICGVNFLIELFTNSVCSVAAYRIYEQHNKK